VITRIELPDLRRVLDEGAQLVEVLPAEAYEKAHLPGATSVPLKQLDADSVAGLDRTRPIVVYCYDYL
jgi:rhodanese-related sulfurtransferase